MWYWGAFSDFAITVPGTAEKAITVTEHRRSSLHLISFSPRQSMSPLFVTVFYSTASHSRLLPKMIRPGRVIRVPPPITFPALVLPRRLPSGRLGAGASVPDINHAAPYSIRIL